MINYIIFDLEWNQSPLGKEDTNDGIPFEIIEIGATKLDENFNIIDTFHRIIKPTVYDQIHFKVFEVIHLGIDELKKQGESFKKVATDFFDWCYSNDIQPIFCTWGNMDLTELQRNLAFHDVVSPFSSPLLYYDIQKLYSLSKSIDTRDKYPLDKAVDELNINQDRPFHNALNDSYYTALIFSKLDFNALKDYISLDYYNIPNSKKDEIYLIFPHYSKYVSSAFTSKESLIADKTISDIICYRCKRMLKKKIKWFSSNQKIYFALSNCPEHGYIRGKIRVKTTDNNEFFAIKTIKLINEEDAIALFDKKTESKKKRNIRNRERKKRLKLKAIKK